MAKMPARRDKNTLSSCVSPGGRHGWRSLAICLILAMVTTPHGAELRVGTRVIQKDAQFELKVGKEVVERRGRIEIYEVEQIHDSWVWLHAELAGLKGWAKAESVVPLDEAIAYFTKQIKANGDDPISYVIRAKVWEAKNDLDIALGDLNEALRLEPNHAWVYNWRGTLWREK